MHSLHDLQTGALTGARHVRLTHCGLRDFPEALFQLADTLEILELSGNHLTTLPDDLPRLKHLRILFASGNPFDSLPSVLGRCPRLEMIGFKSCAITHVPDDSLPEALRWLILTDNRIQQLPDVLGHRPRLQKLMLSCNRLNALPDLSGCRRLELLRLADNDLQSIPQTVFRLPSLAWLAVGSNPFCALEEAAQLDRPTTPVWQMDELETGCLLGEGASGRIFQAHHRPSGQPVALKLFKAARTSDGSPASELAAGLRAHGHSHLLTPLARVDGRPDGGLATALPLLPSGFVPLAGPPDLDSCTRDVYADASPMSPAAVRQLLQDIGNAVNHLHRRKVLHGDLYAHNILWQPLTGHSILSDFGAATLTDGLPSDQREALEAIEWRAYAHLRDELQAHCR